MKFLSKPNLPESPAKLVAVGEGNNFLKQELSNLGIDVISLKSNKNLLGSLSNHADMVLFDCGKGRFYLDSQQEEVCEIINKWGGQAEKITIPENARYPHDVLLNAAVVGENIICNTKTVSDKILQNTDFKIINVNQGYSKCSTCVVNNDAIITDDESICKAACKHIDVMLVNKGDVLLEGFNYGFIGGASVKLSNDIIAFTGKLSTHRDSDNIRAFLNNHSVNIIELSDNKLTDIGGVIPLMV